MKNLIASGLVIALMASPFAVHAQEIPDNIRIIVPGGAGGGTDTVARLFASTLEEKAGVNTIVTNQAAAGGVIATQTLHSAAPDGATLMVAHAKLHTQDIGGSSELGYR